MGLNEKTLNLLKNLIKNLDSEQPSIGQWLKRVIHD